MYVKTKNISSYYETNLRKHFKTKLQQYNSLSNSDDCTRLYYLLSNKLVEE